MSLEEVGDLKEKKVSMLLLVTNMEYRETRNLNVWKKHNLGKIGEAITHLTQEDDALVVSENVIVLQQEQDDNLMFRRALLNP